MTPRQFVIRSITIQPEGVAVEYLDVDRDVRDSGMQLMHVLFVPEGEEWDDEIEALIDAAHALLIDGLQDFVKTPPLDLREVDPSDDGGDEEDESDQDLDYQAREEKRRGK